MLRALLVFVVLGGCNAAAEPPARFPHHRHEHDQKLQQLEAQLGPQVAQLDTLNKRVAALEAALDREHKLVKELQDRISARPPAAP